MKTWNDYKKHIKAVNPVKYSYDGISVYCRAEKNRR